jgi:hypothetical protein
MEVIVLTEAGYDEALLGLSLSYNINPDDTVRIEDIAKSLSTRDGGHNKFLESIVVWLDITAPRYWWQEFDTYRVGVTKQSESTMHTILKQEFTAEDFEDYINFNTIEDLNTCRQDKDFDSLKNLLPEGFLQRRIVCTNYKALRNIFKQRISHRLHQWQLFIISVIHDLDHTEYFHDIAGTECYSKNVNI